VYADPVADFTADTLQGCAPLQVSFSDNTTPGDGTISNWAWDFGDGNVSTDPNPSHTYLSSGTYTVTLVVIDDNGCSHTEVKTDWVTISQVANLDFTATPTNGCQAPLLVDFTTLVSPAGSYSYTWDFGDGNTSTVANPSHLYANDGNYSVRLTIEDASGCQQSVAKPGFILIAQPTADFTVLNPTTCTGTGIQFINQSTGADGYVWNFGDGNTSTATNPTHVYATPGTYSVSLIANNSAGCSDNEIQTSIITINPSPAASFTAPDRQGCALPMTVSFQDLSLGNIISWDWDFGTGQISNAPNPQATFSQPGNYDISLTVTDANGCQNTTTIQDYVLVQPPDAAFATGLQEGCLPLTVNFADLSTSPADPIVSWVWNFGDGNISNLPSPTHTYSTPGIFTVTLTVTTANGCQDTEVLQYIEAGNRPVVDFDANPRVACVNENINFSDLTVGNGTEWAWDFGDGAGSVLPNPTHTYRDTGLFDVRLIVESFGCRDTMIKEDFIRIEGPLVLFDMTPVQACAPPTNVDFIDQSANATSWDWDFGDGSTSSLQNPSHTFSSVGVFQVRLVVTDSITGCSNNYDRDLTITEPQAGFTSSTNFGCADLVVDFTNTSQQATTYFWDFGDGNTSTAASPQHTYTDPGIYTVQLIVSDGICADTLIRTDEVEVVGPSADFSVNIQTGCSPLPVEFSDMSTADAGASLTNWIWDFGDGGSGLGPNPTYTYNAPGDYTVSLTVVDSRGCVDSISKVSFVQPTFPTADFTSADTLTCPGSLVQFQNLSVGNGISSVWDFGDGSPTSNATHPVHLFPNSGSFTITLSVTDANGCTDVRVQSSFINIGKPDAAFTADNTSSTCPPLLVNFRDLSSSDVVSWLWDFGDGSTSNLRSPSKIYTTAAQFDVQLIVTNSVGCRDTLLQEDFIEILGPNGSFTFTPLSGCQPLDVNFTVDSPNPNWTYGWDFGDGTGANGTNVVHTYVTDTLANPILLVEDQNGCIVPVTANNDIWIQPLPNPNFTVDYTDLCLGQTANFSNTSTSERSIADYFWDFGDGNSSTAINPSHTYADTGTYVVSLRATTIDGCVDTSSTPVIIRVTTPPSAAFTVSSIKDCVPFPVAFADASTGNFPLIRWEWDFGDGDQDNGQFISPHTYDSAGTFTATLLVTDSRGCTGNVSRNITVDPLPNVDFSAFQYGCAPITVSFQDLSSSAAGITDWAWQFGDGQLSTVDNPTNLYAADGFYTVSLQVTDGNGCINSLTRTDYIQLEHPTANFTSNAGITCPPQSVQFTDLSSSSSSISWRWDFGDGTSYSNQQNPFHVYQGTDTFDVELIVTDVYGCRDTMLRPAHVITYEPPTASFTLSDSIACVPQTVTFASTSSTNGQGVPLVSYQWNFGAGSGPVSPNTSHAFTSVGTHQVSLAISDGNGCRDTAYKIVQILPNPVADLSADQTNACAPIAIQFTDESNTNPFPVQWEWDFGDGNVSTVRNPINTYLSDGTYTVNLKIQDANGCRDSITYTNYISLDHPEADFTSSTTQICPGVQMQFFDQSTGPRPLTTRIWDFGDGTVVNNALNPTHIYTTPGTYTVSLIVGDGVNCRDTMIQTTLIEVVSGPTAQYAATPGQDCRPMTVAFSDLSTAGATPIVNWQWDFDNGTGSVSASPTQTFPVAGLYDVRLTVTDANGCVASYTDQVEALQTPLVDFTSDTRVGCAPQGIQFTDLTQTSYIKTAFYWDFGDGNTSTAQSPTHTYLADGAYTVSLRVTDQNGCTDSLEKVNYIKLSHPVANFSWNNNEVCPNTPVGVQFVDLSVPDTTLTSWVWDFGDGGTSSAQNPKPNW
ncbi:MAG: PKD domain-containing protein, partial [Bacteroidota bacterium]